MITFKQRVFIAHDENGDEIGYFTNEANANEISADIREYGVVETEIDIRIYESKEEYEKIHKKKLLNEARRKLTGEEYEAIVSDVVEIYRNKMQNYKTSRLEDL